MVPGFLGIFGRTSAGLAIEPDLQVLTWTFLVFTMAMLARGWWLAPSHGTWRGAAWKNRSTYTLVASTILAFSLWGLRFAGKMGESPI